MTADILTLKPLRQLQHRPAGPLLAGEVLPFTGVRYHRPVDSGSIELAASDAHADIGDGGGPTWQHR